MDYRLELLHADDFEGLVNTICQKILGTGAITFAAGKDGGRDGKFTGTANHYPSEKAPWEGKFIIQAKHTANSMASCSDSDFEILVNKEILKIIKLKAAGDIDNYILFCNRKYTGLKGEALCKLIQAKTGLKTLLLLVKSI